MKKIKLTILECNRCHHTWIPRSQKKPKVCPKCNSPYWDKKRVYKLKRLEENR